MTAKSTGPDPSWQALLESIAAQRAVYLTQLVCFVGLAIPAMVVFAAVAVSLTVRRGGFGTALAVLRITTGAFGIVAETLRPIMGMGYLIYGLLLPVWFGWVGWRLLRNRPGQVRASSG